VLPMITEMTSTCDSLAVVLSSRRLLVSSVVDAEWASAISDQQQKAAGD
jgi:hypothetical protein